jgi:hypothetical protein
VTQNWRWALFPLQVVILLVFLATAPIWAPLSYLVYRSQFRDLDAERRPLEPRFTPVDAE